MKSFTKKILIGLVVLAIMLPQLSFADGMMVPPEEYWIVETGQKAVIMYEDGIETMIVSTTFEGDANDFAWVIPVPNKPEVSRGSQELFTNLDGLTGYSYDDPMPYFSLGAESDAVKTGVTIVEQKQIDYYDITVLLSSDKDSLVDWLNENKYNFPTAASYILNSYIDNNWYFVAMRVNPESLEWTDVSQSLREGQATPVVLTFEAKNIVYPLKISSVVSQSESTTDSTYTNGIVKKGVTIAEDDILSFPADTAFSTKEGTVEMWVKPDSTWETSGSGYWELLNVTDSNDQDVFEFRRGKDSRLDNLQFISYTSSGNFLAWKTPDEQLFNWTGDQWYHLAVTWSEFESPVIYVNGTAYELVPGYSSTSWEMKDFSDGTMYLGQRGLYGSSPLQGSLDEVRISSNLKIATEIQEAYLAGLSTQQLTVEDGTLFLAHFDDSLIDAKFGKKMTFEQSINSNGYLAPSYVSILLYVLADNKKALPNFSTDYANWIDKASIENLALDDQGDPLLKLSNKKYFLTKLSNSMTYDQMTEDLFIRDADDNETYGEEIKSTDSNSINSFYIAVLSGIVLSLIFAIIIFVISRKLPINDEK
ncbi:MAG: DUF2330 domain-containing protein [bacterium]|nr:DUF2330 domain-containing protein [bacterium]